VSTRLKEAFGSFHSARQFAQRNGTPPPRTEASTGGHNKKFIIIRMGSDVTGTRSLQPFHSSVLPENPPYKRLVLLERLCALDISEGERPSTAMSFASSSISDSDLDQEDGLRRWPGGGLLRTIIGNTKQNRAKSQSPGRNRQDEQRPPTSTPAATPSDPRAAGYTTSLEDHIATASEVPPFKTHCFRFALESFDHRTGSPPTLQLQTPRLPQPAQLLLSQYLRYGTIINPNTEASLNPATGSNSPGRPNVVTATHAHISPDSPSIPGGVGGIAASLRPISTTPSRSPMDETIPTPTGKVLKPTGKAVENSPYVGRALAEWYYTVNECHMFVERRKSEGVPGNRWVETPLLGAETLRNVR
jgi:hypothetical protein